MKIQYAFLLFFGVLPLEASQAVSRRLTQATANELIVLHEKSCLSWNAIGSKCMSLFGCTSLQEREKARIEDERVKQYNQHQTLIQTLTDLTNLPQDLIALIALYNQATFLLGNRIKSAPCSVEALWPDLVAVGCSDGSILLVDVVDGKIERTLFGHTAPVNALCHSQLSGELASLSTLDGSIPTQLFFESCNERDLTQSRVRAQSSEQEQKDRDETLRIWSFGREPTFGPRGYVKDLSTAVSTVELHPSYNFTCLLKPSVACENEAEKKKIIEEAAQVRHDGLPTSIVRERVWTATCSAPHSLITQENDVINYWYVEQQQGLPQGTMSASLKLPDGRTVIGWSTGEITIMDSQMGLQYCLQGHSAPVRVFGAFIALKGILYLVSGADDKTLRVWNTDTKRCTQLCVGHTAPIRGLKVSLFAEGFPYLVSIAAEPDCTLRKWALEGLA